MITDVADFQIQLLSDSLYRARKNVMEVEMEWVGELRNQYGSILRIYTAADGVVPGEGMEHERPGRGRKLALSR